MCRSDKGIKFTDQHTVSYVAALFGCCVVIRAGFLDSCMILLVEHHRQGGLATGRSTKDAVMLAALSDAQQIQQSAVLFCCKAQC